MAALIGLELIRSCGIRLSAFGLAETFTNGALNANKTGTELVFGQFTDTADATIAQVVNIVNLAFAVAKLEQSPSSYR